MAFRERTISLTWPRRWQQHRAWPFLELSYSRVLGVPVSGSCSGTCLPHFLPQWPLCLKLFALTLDTQHWLQRHFPRVSLLVGIVTCTCHPSAGGLSRRVVFWSRLELDSKTLSQKRNTGKQKIISSGFVSLYPMCYALRVARISLPNLSANRFHRRVSVSSVLYLHVGSSKGPAHYSDLAEHRALYTAGIQMLPDADTNNSSLIRFFGELNCIIHIKVCPPFNTLMFYMTE